MATKIIERVKLGAFVLAGLALLIFALFKLGQNRTLFSSTIDVKTHFRNVGGLVEGNNVRLSGINVGTVESVKILNDTTIEVEMVLEEKMTQYIRKNAQVSLGTDGIIGNRIINITPVKGDAPFIQSGDFLTSTQDLDTDKMLRTLDRTNQNIADITDDLALMLRRFTDSPQLNRLLSDETMSNNIIDAFENIRRSTDEIHGTLYDLRKIVEGVKAGKGSVGQLLMDTTLSSSLNDAVTRLGNIETQTYKITQDIDSVVLNLNSVVKGVDQSINDTNGPIGLMLNDTATTRQLQALVTNLNETTVMLEENMEAMRHNFLFKGYFEDKEKQQKKEEKARLKAEKKAKKKQD